MYGINGETDNRVNGYQSLGTSGIGRSQVLTKILSSPRPLENKMHSSWTESQESIETRKVRILQSAPQTVKATTGSAYQQALRTASRLLQAKQIKDERNKALCVCLQYIGDNGYCPVHGPGFSNSTTGGAHD